MNAMEAARKGQTTPEMERVAAAEGVKLEDVVAHVAAGTVVIVPGRNGTPPVALGDLVRSKVLCNLGTSVRSPEIEFEAAKARSAVARGGAVICDQSVGPNVAVGRARLLKEVPVPFAAVPLYQNAETARRERENPLAFEAQEVIRVFDEQVCQGITAPGIHTMTRELREKIRQSRRVMPLVSRGGSILAYWMDVKRRESPYIEYYDEVLNICAAHGVPLTLICSCRAGCIEDGFDSLQEFEMGIVAGLVKRAHARGVGAIADGLGHMSMDQIPGAVAYFKRTCGGIPLGVMGPATTDRGLAHEHVVNAIGTALAVQHGANYCNACARTEHLGLPEPSDIPDAIGAAVIATYAGDLARGKYRELDLEMAKARKQNAWGVQLSMALDGVGARETFKRVGSDNKHGEGCSICGDLCPFTIESFAQPQAADGQATAGAGAKSV
jgi:phosphomethylpyrimidine synthase